MGKGAHGRSSCRGTIISPNCADASYAESVDNDDGGKFRGTVQLRLGASFRTRRLLRSCVAGGVSAGILPDSVTRGCAAIPEVSLLIPRLEAVRVDCSHRWQPG